MNPAIAPDQADTSPRLTDQQRRPVEAAGESVALTAGAGTGKTTVLTERILAYVQGPSPIPLDRIVAVTFTEKAALEIKDRVRRECHKRLLRGDDRARWLPITRELETARIGTFHSFCADVLRRFAVEAGLDPEFGILEELIASGVRGESLGRALRQALATSNADLKSLAIALGLSAVRDAAGQLLKHQEPGELARWSKLTSDELIAHWRANALARFVPRKLAGISELTRTCIDLCERANVTEPKMRDRLAALQDACARLDREPADLRAVDTIRENATVAHVVKKKWPDPDLYNRVRDEFETLRKQIDDASPMLNPDEAITREAAEAALRFARLATEARRSYAESKRASGRLDFNDLQLACRRLLRRNRRVREELANSIDVILVDEFQDTDPIQDEVLRLLAGPELTNGRIFLVGDEKQSIYRFRGARPELFEQLRQRLNESGRMSLTENFRSAPGVLDFVNALFLDEFGVEHHLRVSPRTPPRNNAPSVEFLWACDPHPSEDDAANPSDANADARRRTEARWIARHLAQRLAEGWVVRDPRTHATRPATQGDVAILFRTLNDAAPYEQALAAEGLDFHIVGGAAFFAQQEVMDLISLLSVLEDPLDSVALAAVLRSPFFAISDVELYWLATSGIGELPLALARCAEVPELRADHRARVVRARDLLERWRRAKDTLPISELVSRVLEESGYEAAVLGESLGERKRANLRKIVRQARQFDLDRWSTLADFVARLRADLRTVAREVQAATTEEQGDFVRLMTIHQAKGLEFPIVVVPDLNRKGANSSETVAFDVELGPLVRSHTSNEQDKRNTSGKNLGWLIHVAHEKHEDDKEAMRVFYVALTRARDYLVLSSGHDADADPRSPAMKLLAERFDRSTGACLAELPLELETPNVRVVREEPAPIERRAGPRASRPRLLDVAARIRLAPSPPPRAAPRAIDAPLWLDLNPASDLAPSAAARDRLLRAILRDPRFVRAETLPEIAAESARRQVPACAPKMVADVVAWLEPVVRGPIGELLRACEIVETSTTWTLRWPESDASSTVIRGSLDCLARGVDGALFLVQWMPPNAHQPRELLRARLSARSAQARIGAVAFAWLIEIGSANGPIRVDGFDDAAIELDFKQCIQSDSAD